MIGSCVPDDARQSLGAPSAFFREHQARLEATAQIGPALDLACGKGRHAIAAADLGLSVLAVDRNQEALDELSRIRPRAPGQLETLQADLELSAPPPLEAASFGAVLVSRYLHRPIIAWMQSLIAADGVLLYETFTRDQRELGWGPTRDDFLLEIGELPTLFSDLEVQVYEEGPSKDDGAPRTARLIAVRKS